MFAGLNSAGSFCGVPYYSSLTNQSVNYLENGNLDIKTILNGHYSLSSSSSSITDIRSGEIEIKVQGNGDENYNFYFIAPYTSDLILLSPKSIVVNPGLTTAVFDISELKSGYWFYSFAENASGEIVKSSGLREFLVGNEVTQSASAHTKVEKIFITLNNKKVLAGQSISNQEAIEFWENNTGYSADNFFYYRILCLFKFSVIMIRVAKKLIHNEIMPLDSDFHINNHVSNYLRQEFNEKN